MVERMKVGEGGSVGGKIRKKEGQTMKEKREREENHWEHESIGKRMLCFSLSPAFPFSITVQAL